MCFFVVFCMNNYNPFVINLLLFTSNASQKSGYNIGNQLNTILLYLFFPQMKLEKKAVELTDSEKTILEVLKANNSMELNALKNIVGLSGKQWDAGMKGLSKHGMVKVEVNGDTKMCVLK